MTDVGKYRILDARVEAWVRALHAAGLARSADVPATRWVDAVRDPEAQARVRRITPARPGGLSILFAATLVDGAPFGLDVGLAHDQGQPVLLQPVPDCGCDACDSGSADLLEELDGWVLTVARGGVVRARRGAEQITRTLHGWQGTGAADPSWLDESIPAPAGTERWVGVPWAG